MQNNNSFRYSTKRWNLDDDFVPLGLSEEDKHKNAMLLFWIVLGIASVFLLWRFSQPRLREYNKYMCAVNGYQEDCQTPLRPEDRLQ